MAGPWEKYQQQSSSGSSKPWKNYAQETLIPEDKKEDISKLESGLRGAAQGISLGFEDELIGVLKTIGDLPAVVSGDYGISDLYTQYRDLERAKNERAKQANPLTFTGGELVGGIGSMAIPGLNVAKGASVAQAAKTAALAGGLSTVGANTGSLTDVDNLKKISSRSSYWCHYWCGIRWSSTGSYQNSRYRIGK